MNEAGKSPPDSEPDRSFVRTEVRLSYANGFRMLGMFAEAEKELAKVVPEDRLDREVLAIQVALWQDAGDWEKMMKPARTLRLRHPEEIDWWIADAYATRRCRELEEAMEILLEAEKLHVHEPCIKYNLGCYACLAGDQATSLRYVLSAFALDPKYAGMALEDEDLVDLQDKLQEMGWGKDSTE